MKIDVSFGAFNFKATPTSGAIVLAGTTLGLLVFGMVASVAMCSDVDLSTSDDTSALELAE